jgi:hypothetical protein
MNQTDIGSAASRLTDAQFSNEISSFVRLSQTEIDTLFPMQNDKQQLSALVDIVLNAANDNERMAKLVNGIGNVAGAVIKLLKTGPIPT